MRALLLTLIAGTAFGQVINFNPNLDSDRSEPGRDHYSRVPRAGGRGNTGLAFFEFAPSSGAGMGAPCACTTPTGARGESLTFTRASNGTCTKTSTGGLATTGIANGDLVVCSTNQPRVEYDGAGTLGLLVEASRTNNVIQNQAIDNAAWSVLQNSGIPTVTADFAVDPLGTTTAERVQFAATAVGQYSLLYQGNGCAVSQTDTGSVYVKGNGTSGTIDLFTYDGTTFTTVPMAYNASTWSRYGKQVVNGAAATEFGFGNFTLWNGAVVRGAADVLISLPQCEIGAYATSPIPTTTVAVTRAGEAPSFTLSPGVGPNGCIAGNATFASTAIGAADVFGLGVAGAGNNWGLYRSSDTAAGFQIGGTVVVPAVSSMGITSHRWSMSDNAGTRTATFDAVSKTPPAASMSGAQTSVTMTSLVGIGQSSTIYNRIQIDPSPGRCSP